MYKASQEALTQQINQGLVGIRNQEIQYHVNVYATFGNQAALIGGFTYGKFLSDFESIRKWSHHTQTAYYICASITITSAIMVIILTMIIQVLAPGLALHGPVGSMARATDGMKAEQKVITMFFTLMMVSFTIATVLAVWTIQDDYAALSSSIVFFIMACSAYYYVRRTIARFWWLDSETLEWDDAGLAEPKTGLTRDGRVSSLYVDDQIRADARERAQLSPIHGDGDSTPAVDTQTPTTSQKTRRVSTKFMNWLIPSSAPGTNNTNPQQSVEMMTTNGTATGNKIDYNAVAMEGYMTKRVKSKKEFLKDPWERRYFVLNYRGEFYYYKNRQVYRSDPLNGREEKRPIELDDYSVKYFNTISPGASGGIVSRGQNPTPPDDSIDPGDVSVTPESNVGDGMTTSVVGNLVTTAVKSVKTTIGTSNQSKPIFQFKLVPLSGSEVLMHYGLRCDTEEEFSIWLEAMQSVSIADFEESYYSDK